MELSSHHSVLARISVGWVEDERVVRRSCSRVGRDPLPVLSLDPVPSRNAAVSINLGTLNEFDTRMSRCDVLGISVSLH